MSATTMQQTSVKALADRVLQRNQPRNRHATKSCAAVATDATGTASRATELHGIPLAELRELAGKDWSECERDPALLEAFASMVAIRKMRDRGEVPPHYTAITVCAGCGPVPIFPGCPPKVLGCPWCLNRAAGTPVPRPGKQRKEA